MLFIFEKRSFDPEKLLENAFLNHAEFLEAVTSKQEVDVSEVSRSRRTQSGRNRPMGSLSLTVMPRWMSI